ncbi:MAG: hypothetical protein ACXABY_02295 [Candidatus Thorarchaeota archaeon]|jgi:hypothetical protein
MSLLEHLRTDIADDGSVSQPIPLIPGQTVEGPGTSKDDGIATWDGTTGDVLQSTPACVDDVTGDIVTPGAGTFGGKLTLNSSICFNCRNITAAGNITVLATDAIVAVNKTVGAATTVTLPSTTDEGRMVIIKDKKGDASTNNITTVVSGGGMIDGLAGFILPQNYQSITLTFCGGSWSII